MDYWEHYDQHYRHMNPDLTPEAYARYSAPELDPHLPRDKSDAILDVGCGSGLLLHYLARKGYTNLTGVEISAPQLELAKERLPGGIKLIQGDAAKVLNKDSQRYKEIFFFDVIEHIRKENMQTVLEPLVGALQPGGRLWIRTPNMANPFGAYSRYLDYTHEVGFTEYSLVQVMAPFKPAGVRFLDQNPNSGLKQRLYLKLRNGLCRKFMRYDGRTLPTVFDKNLLAVFQF